MSGPRIRLSLGLLVLFVTASWLLAVASPAVASPSLKIAKENGQRLGLVAGWTPTRTVWLHYGAMSDSNWLLRAKNGSSGTWGNWHDYKPTTLAFSWRLTSGYGKKTVYLQYKREANSTSYTGRGTISLDSTRPKLSAGQQKASLSKIAYGRYKVTSRSTGSDNSGRWRWLCCYDLEGSFGGIIGENSYEAAWDHNYQVARHVENFNAESGYDPLPADLYKVTVTDYAIDRAGNRSKPVTLRRSFRVDGLESEDSGNPGTAGGPDAGGDTVYIIGSGFTGATAVTFGGTAAASFKVLSGNAIRATSPAGTGSVDVTVVTSKGTRWSAGQYFYDPAVTGLSPIAGPTAGGNTLTITGSGFTGDCDVTFTNTWTYAEATSVKVLSDTTIQATAPAGTGTVDVFVLSATGSSVPVPADQYTYFGVTSLSPTVGPIFGGNSVTITGSGFTGATAVSFGGVAATSFEVLSSSTIQATAPAGTGTVGVSVTTPQGQGAIDNGYRYDPDITAIAGLSPATGPTAGGNKVTITGSGFDSIRGVAFGGTEATSFNWENATTILATAPAGTGTVDVTVFDYMTGRSAPVLADEYTYIP